MVLRAIKFYKNLAANAASSNRILLPLKPLTILIILKQVLIHLIKLNWVCSLIYIYIYNC